MGETNRNIDINYDLIVKIFNEDGKKAATAFIEKEYKSSYTLIQRKLRKESNYIFNKNTRKYEIKVDDKVKFMSMEELCQEKAEPTIYVEKESPKMDSLGSVNDDFKNLMLNLMKDRMQELNKYIYFEQSTNQVIINLEKLKSHGYKVIIN